MQSPSDYLRNKDWLITEYTTKGKSIAEIARDLSCDGGYVWRWLVKHDIPRRPSHRPPRRTGPRSPEEKAKMSQGQKQRHKKNRERNLILEGKPYSHSKEVRQKISQKLKVYYATHPEAREALAERGRSATPRGSANRFWKGGTSNKWISMTKNIILSERKNACCICGYNRVFIAHHIDRNRENNDPANVIIVCANCHYLIHHNQLTLEEQKRLDQHIKLIEHSENEKLQ